MKNGKLNDDGTVNGERATTGTYTDMLHTLVANADKTWSFESADAKEAIIRAVATRVAVERAPGGVALPLMDRAREMVRALRGQ